MVANVKFIWRGQKIIDQKLFIGFSTEWKLLMNYKIFASDNSIILLHVTKVSNIFLLHNIILVQMTYFVWN